MPENEEVGYYTQTVAEQLNLTGNQLRHMSAALERHGYRFERNKRRFRIYFEQDMRAIRQLQHKMSEGKNADEAAGEVCAEIGAGASEIGDEVAADPRAPLPQTREVRMNGVRMTADQLRMMVEEVAATTAEQTAGRVIEKYGKAIERTIAIRDKQLVSRLREANELAREKNRKGWLSRMFGSRR